MNRLATAALLAGLLSLPAYGQPIAGTLKRIADTQSIALGYLPESVPFSFADSQKNPAGY